VITNKREIKTKVMVEDNGLVILGGLISDELSTSNQRVPLLGDILIWAGCSAPMPARTPSRT
jgi:general secretion pathway protein D